MFEGESTANIVECCEMSIGIFECVLLKLSERQGGGSEVDELLVGWQFRIHFEAFGEGDCDVFGLMHES